MFLGRGRHHAELFADSAGTGVFFALLVAVGNAAAEGRTYTASRNHPDYLAQGTVPAEHGRVDWLAVQRADGVALAVVNTRLFDLRFGRVVLVAPQPDGTVRFRQVAAPPLSREDLGPYVEALLAHGDAADFFSAHDSPR